MLKNIKTGQAIKFRLSDEYFYGIVNYNYNETVCVYYLYEGVICKCNFTYNDVKMGNVDIFECGWRKKVNV